MARFFESEPFSRSCESKGINPPGADLVWKNHRVRDLLTSRRILATDPNSSGLENMLSRRIGILSLLHLLAAVGSTNVWANAGPPSKGGHYAGEPAGVLAVAIARERLTIDMRPLSNDALVQVEASYELHNRGTAETIELIFAVGSLGVTNFQVWLDEEPIASAPAADAKLPQSWKAPAYTPGLNGKSPLEYAFYGRSQMTPMSFSIALPPGTHTLQVRYAAEASTHFDGNPTVYRQFAYVLAPARSWAGFGTLDVNIRLPAGWIAASTPLLTRTQDTLTGSFEGIPADAIALTVQAPTGKAYHAIRMAGVAGCGVIVLVGILCCWKQGSRLGRATQQDTTEHGVSRQKAVWPWALGLGLAWAVLTLAWGIGTLIGPSFFLPTHQATRWNYLQFFGIIAICSLAPLVLALGSTLVLVSARLAK